MTPAELLAFLRELLETVQMLLSANTDEEREQALMVQAKVTEREVARIRLGDRQ